MISHELIDPHLPRGWLISLTLQQYWKSNDPVYQYEDTRYFLEFIEDDTRWEEDYLIVLQTPDGDRSEWATDDTFVEVLSELAHVPVKERDGK